MKKTFVLSLVLLLATAYSSFAQKFGYCNSLALIAELPEVKQANSDVEAYQTQLQKKGQEMVKAFEDKANELQRKQQQGTIAPKDYSDQEAKLKEEEQKINEYAQTLEQELAKKREDLFKPILDRVNQAITEVSKEGGYFMILDTASQVLLYADESMDVTKMVQAKLAAMPPK